MSCSGDRKARVRCFKDKVEREICDGPLGCFPKGETTMGCDSSLGEVGDPCVGKAETCSVDKKSILACTGTRLALHQACPSGKPCDASDVVACR